MMRSNLRRKEKFIIYILGSTPPLRDTGKKPGDQNSSRSQGGVLLMAYSAAFLDNSGPPAWGWHHP